MYMVWPRLWACRIVPDAMVEHAQAVRERVGRNVKRLRLRLGWSQDELAERVGNTGKHIGQIERALVWLRASGVTVEPIEKNVIE